MKRPSLVDGWKRIATRSWSMLCWYASTVLGFMDLATPYVSALQDLLPEKTFACVSLAFAAAGMVARLLPQAKLRPDPDATVPPAPRK